MSTTYRCASFIGNPTITVKCDGCGAEATTRNGKRPRPKHEAACSKAFPKSDEVPR